MKSSGSKGTKIRGYKVAVTVNGEKISGVVAEVPDEAHAISAMMDHIGRKYGWDAELSDLKVTVIT